MTEDQANVPALRGQAPKPGREVQAFIPGTSAEILWTIQTIVKGGLVPDSYKDNQGKPDENAMAIGIMKGLELGVPPLTALANIAIINNRPTMWGDLMVAMVLKTGLMVGYNVSDIGGPAPDSGDVSAFADNYGCEVHLYRRGVEGAFLGRFTVGDAKRAGLWMHPKKKPWLYYPKRMLRQRAMGFALRDGFADCLAGMYFREEIEDMSAKPKDVDRAFLDSSPAKSPPELEPVVSENQPAAEASVSDHSDAESDLVDASPQSDATAGWTLYREDGSEVGVFDTPQWIEAFCNTINDEIDAGASAFPLMVFTTNQKTFKEVLKIAGQNQKTMLIDFQDLALGYGRKAK